MAFNGHKLVEMRQWWLWLWLLRYYDIENWMKPWKPVAAVSLCVKDHNKYSFLTASGKIRVDGWSEAWTYFRIKLENKNMCICSQSFWQQLINERWCSLSNCIILFIIHYCVKRSVRGWAYHDLTNVWQQIQMQIVRFQHIQSSGCLLSLHRTRYSRPRPQPPLHNPCPELRAANC